MSGQRGARDRARTRRCEGAGARARKPKEMVPRQTHSRSPHVVEQAEQPRARTEWPEGHLGQNPRQTSLVRSRRALQPSNGQTSLRNGLQPARSLLRRWLTYRWSFSPGVVLTPSAMNSSKKCAASELGFRCDHSPKSKTLCVLMPGSPYVASSINACSSCSTVRMESA